jgi:orotate phosphoribosyltransferase
MTAAANEAELLELIRTRSFKRGLFKLASGAESDRYFNLKPTMMHPRGAYLAARAFIDRIAPEGVDYVGGLEMGAVPLIGAVAALSEAEGHPVKTFFARKAAKGHGTKETVEGLGPNDSLNGVRVLVLDDVATSGGSILKTVEIVRDLGAVVEAALVLLDREEGAEAMLANQGVRLLSVFKAPAFL